MKYYCSQCKKIITFPEYKYSKDKFNKALCREHQKTKKESPILYRGSKYTAKKSTPEARALYYALKKRGVPVFLEKFDGYKHIDIAIPEAKVNIEVDGMQHSFNKRQALADLKRTFHSFKKGFVTLRIPNTLVKENLEETAEYIVHFLNASLDQLEDEFY